MTILTIHLTETIHHELEWTTLISIFSLSVRERERWYLNFGRALFANSFHKHIISLFFSIGNSTMLWTLFPLFGVRFLGFIWIQDIHSIGHNLNQVLDIINSCLVNSPNLATKPNGKKSFFFYIFQSQELFRRIQLHQIRLESISFFISSIPIHDIR